MGTLEFPNLGRHCSIESCQQIDFLPFTCDKCTKVYCLEHRSYSEHKCPNAREGDSVVIICPLCAQPIRLPPNGDPNQTWNQHVASKGCDPSNYEKATKKKKCPAKGCKENLTFSNKFLCKECSQETCLKHRFGLDHNCPGKPEPEASSLFNPNFFQQTSSSLGSWFSSSQKPSGNSQAKPKSQKPQVKSTTPKGEAKRPGDKKVVGASQKVKDRIKKVQESTSTSGSRGSEECPQCNSKFQSVTELISHVESSHLGGSGKPPKAALGYGLRGNGTEICPNCKETFNDVQSLVKHVETRHLEKSQEKCRIS